MNSLLRTVNSMTNRKYMLVRESLQQQLKTTVLEIQNAPAVVEGRPVEVCDEALAMCLALEAIFLHGLKDSFLNRMTEALSGPDYDAMPQPSFWGPVLVFSHRGIIDQLQSLSQVTTEVGYCRAWIRLVLNEGLLSSYLSSICRDQSALKPYYKRAAFIRDADLVEVTQRVIESIEHIHFELVCNSSLLNFWSSTPLLLAAIWSPPMKSCPIFCAIDIAKTITCERPNEENSDEIEAASSIDSLGSFNSSQDNLSNLFEDEALKIILAKKSISRPMPPDQAPTPRGGRPTFLAVTPRIEWPVVSFRENGRSPEPTEEALKVEESYEAKATISGPDEGNKAGTAVVGNSLISKLGWSTSYKDCGSSVTSSAMSRNDGHQTPAEGSTYDALLKSYHTGSYQSLNLEELLEKYPLYEPASTSPDINQDDELCGRCSFDEQLCRLACDKGLDLQNYNCLECGQLIGLAFAKANLCYFTGNYFCCNCIATEEYLIPSRLIHNWDLKLYPVSTKAAKYLAVCTTLLDFKIINPRIYNAVDCMAQLHTLRVQLNLLRAYLFTCREPTIESLQKKVTPKDYLYEHVHQYSILDLPDIPNGTLAQQLRKVVEFARNHVLNCWLCSQKGFVCEICNDSKIIYPFDTHSTYRCAACNAVFHLDCSSATKPCPKCDRRRKRMDLPLLDMSNADLLNENAL